jgi:hypothetical protein
MSHPATFTTPVVPAQQHVPPLALDSSSSSSSDDAGVVEVAVASAATTLSPIDEATVEDIVVTLESTNPLKKLTKNQVASTVMCTRLSLICNVEVARLTVDNLRQFASRVSIAGARRMSKPALCEAIIARKAQYDKDRAEGRPDSLTAPVRVIINRKRLLNVCFGDVLRPNLGERGGSLTADELTRGVKRGQLFFGSVADEYNNTHKYNENEHPGLTTGRSNSPPSKFDPISWQKAKSAFEELVSEYEKCFLNWKQSGNHDDFDDAVGRVAGASAGATTKKPFIEFVQRNWVLLYMHEFVYEYPDALSKMTGKIDCCVPLFVYNFSLAPFNFYFRRTSGRADDRVGRRDDPFSSEKKAEDEV